MNTPSNTSVAPSDEPRQKNMTDTAQITLSADFDFLNVTEVSRVLRCAPISVYRLIARRALPVYRACRKILFKRADVLDYLERSRSDTTPYGRP
jgi:excisionase family DNA binding protein